MYNLLTNQMPPDSIDRAYASKPLLPPRQLNPLISLEMEQIIQTAMQLYEKGTGDKTVWDYLPRQSWENLGAKDIKAHLWVNSGLGSYGTADALRNFNMGRNVSYEELLPGSFINFRRSNGTSHAAVFMYYVDLYGRDSETWNESKIGFRYFSSQGR